MGIFGIFGRVIVDGTSMQPTYNPLDWLLVHYGFFGKKYLFLRVGDVVVIERETQPGIFYVKRIAEIAIQNTGEKKGEEIEVNNYLTHQDIANMVGSSREMVSRIFKQLTIGGYVASEGKRILGDVKIDADGLARQNRIERIGEFLECWVVFVFERMLE